MLARVENHECAGIAKPRGHSCQRVGAANVDGVGKEPDGVGLCARAREVDEPHAVRELVLERAGGLEREPALAHARRPGERYETVLAQEAGDLGQLVVAADERRRRRGKVATTPAVDRDGGDRRIVREDRFLKAPQLEPRLEPQLVGEHAPRLLERLERIRLAAAAIERQHQLAPQPLPERVLSERRLKRRDELPMLSERERNLELLFERVDVQRLQPACLVAEPRRTRSAPAAPVRASGPAPIRPRPPRQERRHRAARRASPPAALRTERHRPMRPSVRSRRVSRRSTGLPARREGGRCDDAAHCAERPGASPPTGRRRASRRRPHGRGAARASPAGPDASSRPRPRASRPPEPRTGREAGSPAAPAYARVAFSGESLTLERLGRVHRLPERRNPPTVQSADFDRGQAAGGLRRRGASPSVLPRARRRRPSARPCASRARLGALRAQRRLRPPVPLRARR